MAHATQRSMKLCYGAVAIIYLAIGNNINDKVADVIHKYC